MAGSMSTFRLRQASAQIASASIVSVPVARCGPCCSVAPIGRTAMVRPLSEIASPTFSPVDFAQDVMALLRHAGGSNEGEEAVAFAFRHHVELCVPLLALLRDEDVDEFLAEHAAGEGAFVKRIGSFEERPRQTAQIAAL